MTFIVDKSGRRRELQTGEVLQDGERLVVKLQLMDHRSPAVHDGMGREAGHRPGFLFSSSPSEADMTLDAARADYVRNLSNAWRNPSAARPASASALTEDAYADHEKWLVNSWRTR